MNQRQDVPSVLGGRPEAGCHVWKVTGSTRKDSVEEEVSVKPSKEAECYKNGLGKGK